MSLFNELKRRNVFRVGIAYVVGAWLLLQLTDVLSELLNLPETIGPTVVTIVAIGLPIVLFAAWAFEMTPEGIKREEEVDRSQSITPQTGKRLNHLTMLMLALAVAYLLFDKFYAVDDGVPAPESITATEPASVTEKAESTATEASPKSIAVLPFTNRSRLEDDAFFVEGMHDDLLTNLARIGSLKVISRTSVMRYKDTDIPIPEIAKELGVATVMEGAVQRSGNSVRINVQLIDANTDEHLWAEIFDRELTAENLFAIQSEISEKIAAALKTTLSPEEHQAISERPTENLAAYDAYLLGRQLMARRDTESLTRAQEEFRKATALDPDFALAWIGLAETTLLNTGNSGLPFTETMKIAEDSANKALAINDQLGEAYLSLAQVEEFYERNENAEANYHRAIELSPGYATAFQWYSDFLDNYPHRRKEALDMLREAETLDPFSSIIQNEIADQLVLLGQFEAAEYQLNRLIQKDPGFMPAYQEMSSLMNVTGQFDEQYKWLHKASELDPGNIGLYVQQAFTLLDLGDSAGLARIKQKMADADDQHWALGWIETIESMHENNISAALESAKWVDEQTGGFPGFQNVYGWVYLLNKDYQNSRRSFAIAYPNYFDRSTWRTAIEKDPSFGCFISYVMSMTGDEELAADLVKMSISYLENELPNYVQHADRYFYEACYLMSGDSEKFLEQLATTFEHGHYSSWWLWSKLPMFDSVRGTEEFESFMHNVREETARQRANLASWEPEAKT